MVDVTAPLSHRAPAIAMIGPRWRPLAIRATQRSATASAEPASGTSTEAGCCVAPYTDDQWAGAGPVGCPVQQAPVGGGDETVDPFAAGGQRQANEAREVPDSNFAVQNRAPASSAWRPSRLT